MIPHEQSNPEATAIFWRWLSQLSGVQSVRVVPRPIPPSRLCGVRPWRCAIVLETDHVVTGEGDGHREAHCRAVLAVAQAMTPQRADAQEKG